MHVETFILMNATATPDQMLGEARAFNDGAPPTPPTPASPRASALVSTFLSADLTRAPASQVAGTHPLVESTNGSRRPRHGRDLAMRGCHPHSNTVACWGYAGPFWP